MRILCLVVCLVGGGWLPFSPSLRAQEGQPKTIHFSLEDYGGDNQNWDITQGEDRTLYVANSAGVLAYDGARWRRFDLPGRPVIRSVAYAGGKLYAGGYGQFGYFKNLDAPTPDYVSLAEQLPKDQRREEIWNIETLADGTVVFHSFARFYAFANDRLIANEAPGILLFARSLGDHLVVPVTNQGLYRWSAPKGFKLIGGSAVLGDRTVSSFLPWQNGYLVGTEDTTFLLRDGRLRPTPLPNRVNRLHALSDGQLAVGTIDDGIYLYDSTLTFQLQFTRENGLGNNTVLALWEDEAKDLWVGLDQGLALLDRNAPLRFSAAATEELGTVYTAINQGGYFYLGTNQGLFAAPSDRKDDLKLVPGTSGQVWGLRRFADRLLCAHNEGTFVVHERAATLLPGGTGVWETLPHPADTTLYAQASYTGLSLLNRSEPGSKLSSTWLDAYVAPLRDIAWVGERTLLAAHASSGVLRLRLNAQRRGYERIDTLHPTLSKATIAQFGDTVLVQNVEGVYLYSGDHLEPITNFRGVAVPSGALILPGREALGEWFLLWGHRTTLYRHGTAVTTLAVRLDANYPVILPFGENQYLFCLHDGYAFFDAVTESAASPQLSLYRQEEGPDFRVYAAALPVFDRPVRYRYRLKGRQDTWSAWTDRSEFSFYELWEGTYTLEVEADWFGAATSEVFVIHPPWYRSAFAYVLYGLAVAGLLLLLYRLHRQRLATQKRRLELLRRRQLQRQKMQARNRELEDRISAGNRELANTTLALAKKNEILLELRENLDRGRPEKVRHLIERNLNSQEDWAIFEDHFNEVHKAFLGRLRHHHPNLTTGDLQLAAYLKMDLPSKEIAPLLHISVRGVENKRYRLRKKLGLEGEQNLNQYLKDL